MADSGRTRAAAAECTIRWSLGPTCAARDTTLATGCACPPSIPWKGC